MRLNIYQRLLTRYQAEEDEFFHPIITYDYTLETKRASTEWRKQEEAGSVKAKTRLSVGKVLATLFSDISGVLLWDFLHGIRTVNTAYYCELLDRAEAAYEPKVETDQSGASCCCTST